MSLRNIVLSRPILMGAILTITAVLSYAGLTLAWGPDRATFTTAKPADYITFNSIVDNPAYGDERAFYRVKPASADNSAYSDKTALEPGKEYQAYVYYHNNAAANLNLVAENTNMRIELPAVVNGDTKSNAFISASNAKPTQVFDDTTLTSTSAVALRMVPGSATIHSKGAVNGKTLPDSIITTGTPLGYNALDGKLPGCNDFAGYVTFRFVADQPNFTVQKEVSKHGENKWSENYQAKPGEVVDFLLQYKNTGTTLQSDVVIKDQLPKGMSYVAGSAILGNPTNPAGVKTNDTVTTTGLNVGAYNPGQNAWVIFSAKVDAVEALACGTSTLTNKQIVETNNGSKDDTATVTVVKDCTPPPVEKVKACNLDTKKLEDNVEKSKIDDVHYTLDLEKCADTPQPKQIEVCRLSDKKYPVTINESDFDSTKYSKNPADCTSTPAPEKIKVCDLSDKTIKTIEKSQFNADTMTTDLSKCDTPVTPKPEQVKVCDTTDQSIKTINKEHFDSSKMTTDLSKCDKKPVTPETPAAPAVAPELPKTGADPLFGAIGIGALIYATYAYIISRRV